jgi:predicted amidophosphoribosyltransferase
MTDAPCPSCGKPKKPDHYLCAHCWWQLPKAMRSRLWKSDALAMARLQELYDQIGDHVPLSEIEVTA